jgi:hypothetical protein
MKQVGDGRACAWARGLVVGVLGLLLVCVLAWAAVIQQANRSVEPPSMAERQRAYDQALAWVHRNEPALLAEGNAALWWMIQAAADVQNDDYLKDLVARALVRGYPDPSHALPWKRMVQPKAEVVFGAVAIDALADYQRFFLHALTCHPVALASGDTTRFFTDNQCRPLVGQLMPSGDPVCATHQLMGIAVAKRVRCELPPQLPELESQLMDDVATQLAWDPIVRDAYIQRVLTLAWLGQAQQVKPIWMRRVFEAQQPDGGWAWGWTMPEWPYWMQPLVIRAAWREHVLKKPPQMPYVTDFHPTAQGLLLAALALHEKPQALTKP